MERIRVELWQQYKTNRPTEAKSLIVNRLCATGTERINQKVDGSTNILLIRPSLNCFQPEFPQRVGLNHSANPGNPKHG